MKQALVLVGSPRGKKSSSTSLGNHLMSLFEKRGWESEILWLNRQVKNDDGIVQMLDAVEHADIVVLTAPLYDDCQPSIVIKAMEAIADQKTKSLENKKFIPIINCGLPEPEQITAVSIDIYHKFAKMVGFQWAGSLAIGGGEMIQGKTGKSLDDMGRMAGRVKKALDEIAETLTAGTNYADRSIRTVPDFFYKPGVAKLMTRLTNHFWKSQAKKNGGIVDTRPFSQ